MPLYPDSRVCKNCGRMGVTRKTCEVCPCQYCHKKDHPIIKCPTVPPCQHCGTKGLHRSDHCLQRVSLTQQSSASTRHSSASTRHSSTLIPDHFNISVSPLAHDSLEWREIPQETRDVRMKRLAFIKDNN